MREVKILIKRVCALASAPAAGTVGFPIRFLVTEDNGSGVRLLFRPRRRPSLLFESHRSSEIPFHCAVPVPCRLQLAEWQWLAGSASLWRGSRHLGKCDLCARQM